MAWHATWQQALASAAESGQTVLVYLRTDWSRWCREIDRYTFSDPIVVEEMGLFECATVDPEEEAQAEERFGPEGFPTVVFVFPDGTVGHRVAGYLGPPEFLRQLQVAREKRASYDRAMALARDVLASQLESGGARAELLDVSTEQPAARAVEVARGYADLGLAGHALPWLKLVAEHGPNPLAGEARLLYGCALAQREQWEGSARVLAEALQVAGQQPLTSRARFCVGIASLRRDDRKAAGAAFTDLLQTEPDGPYADTARSALGWLRALPPE